MAELKYRRKLIEVAMPLAAINAEGGQRKRKAPKGYPTQIHTWWAQRPVAAARGVLVAQLLTDPGDEPERFKTQAAIDAERQRLFGLIEEFIKWDTGNRPPLLAQVRREIAQAWARSHPSPENTAVLAVNASDSVVRNYIAKHIPPLHDPFAGGGTIPLEAVRLGLRVVASDLNPVAVLINRALVEAPARFMGRPPINSTKPQLTTASEMSIGLAEDVRHYGAWVRGEAWKRVAKFFPEVEVRIPEKKKRESAPVRGEVVAWLWARTVASPNPAMAGAHVPLMSTFSLNTKPDRMTWLEPVVDNKNRSWSMEIRTGTPNDLASLARGTRAGKAEDFICLLSKTPIPREYVRDEGKAGRLGQRLIAIVARVKGAKGRFYLPATPDGERIARMAGSDPQIADARETFLAGTLPSRAMITGGVCSAYGLSTWGHLFTDRQLLAHLALSDAIGGARERVLRDAIAAGWNKDDDATAYADAVELYLAAALSRTIDYGSTLATWRPKDNAMRSSLPRQAFAMTWDFAEGNPFGSSSSGWTEAVNVVANCIEGPATFRLPVQTPSIVRADAREWTGPSKELIASTDPPYYDNISYAELSDFFYAWLRRTLRRDFPVDLETVLAPKTSELIANAFRHGGKESAEAFFEKGMTDALRLLATRQEPLSPATIYYAFKQTESADSEGASSTGWETFLEGVISAGFTISATWPLRTEGDNRQNAVGANALASSIVLACRRRSKSASSITRSDFRRLLRAELPIALASLQHGNIAPVDVAQASIGPGMAIFSRHERVLETDGAPMKVKAALQLINEVLDEHLTNQEGELDADSRFAVTWYENRAFETGPYGEAETLAKARAVAVEGIAEAGILKSGGGKVRLLKRSELPNDWDPTTDARPTTWEATQHLIKRLEADGEPAAAELLARLGSRADAARDLAYRLYSTCERKGWADEARAYNGLIVAWPDLERLANNARDASKQPAQQRLL